MKNGEIYTERQESSLEALLLLWWVGGGGTTAHGAIDHCAMSTVLVSHVW